MLLFRYWSREKLVDAIVAMEEALSTGAKATSFQGQTISWDTFEEGSAIVRQMYARVDALDGKRNRSGGIRWMRVIPQRGY
jgi:hypothetical protein